MGHLQIVDAEKIFCNLQDLCSVSRAFHGAIPFCVVPLWKLASTHSSSCGQISQLQRLCKQQQQQQQQQTYINDDRKTKLRR